MADVIATVAGVIATVADCTVVDVITTLCWLMVLPSITTSAIIYLAIPSANIMWLLHLPQYNQLQWQ